MNKFVTPCLLIMGLLSVGCAMAMPLAAGGGVVNSDKVTTASGVEIDPSKHRAITYQMW
jgi:hypothetical protein